jgi:hypothetical protein
MEDEGSLRPTLQDDSNDDGDSDADESTDGPIERIDSIGNFILRDLFRFQRV